LGLGEIGLPKLRGHPAGRRIAALLLPHLVFLGKAFLRASTAAATRGLRRSSEARRRCSNGGGGSTMNW
jgi:hypothetical protein